MEQVPPVVPTPPPGPRRRTPVVTAAGGLLITAGVLTILAGLIIVLAGNDVLVNGEPIQDGARTVAIVALVIGGVDVVDGILVLRLVNLARMLGFALAGITVVIGLTSVAQGQARSFLQVLLGVFTIWALAAARPAFGGEPRG